MKKIFSALLIFSLSAALFADDNSFFTRVIHDQNLHISAEPVIGVKNGIIGEYVFVKSPSKASDTGKTADDKLSYLEWQIKNELYAGLRADVDYRNIFAQIKLNAGLPQKSGIVTDSDWLNIQYPAATQEQQTYKTNYSEHDNKIDYDFFMNMNAGYTFNPVTGLSVKPFLGFEFSTIQFSATDGYIWYGKDIATHTGSSRIYKNVPYEKYNSDYVDNEKISGSVLKYHREQTTLWLGTNISYIFPWNMLTLSGSFYVSPYTYTFNQDYHPQADNATYVDICAGAFSYYKVNLEASCFIKKIIIVAGFDWNYLKLIRGDSYQKESGKSTYSIITGQQGGADASFWTLSLGARYKFM